MTRAVNNANLDNLKLDTIQKVINKVKYLTCKLSSSGSGKAVQVQKLAKCQYELLDAFFRKKEKDMRFQPNSLKYSETIWN